MSTATTRAREALGVRLREIRQDVNLTGRALASRCGWHFTKVSKLEHGIQNPSEDDLRAWCHACDAGDQVPDLIATVRAIESMYLEWRRALHSGMKHGQKARIPLYERTKLFRVVNDQRIPPGWDQVIPQTGYRGQRLPGHGRFKIVWVGRGSRGCKWFQLAVCGGLGAANGSNWRVSPLWGAPVEVNWADGRFLWAARPCAAHILPVVVGSDIRERSR